MLTQAWQVKAVNLGLSRDYLYETKHNETMFSKVDHHGSRILVLLLIGVSSCFRLPSAKHAGTCPSVYAYCIST